MGWGGGGDGLGLRLVVLRRIPVIGLAGRLRISDRLKILLTGPKDFVFFSPPIPYFRNNNTASADVIRIL